MLATMHCHPISFISKDFFILFFKKNPKTRLKKNRRLQTGNRRRWWWRWCDWQRQMHAILGITEHMQKLNTQICLFNSFNEQKQKSKIERYCLGSLNRRMISRTDCNSIDIRIRQLKHNSSIDQRKQLSSDKQFVIFYRNSSNWANIEYLTKKECDITRHLTSRANRINSLAHKRSNRTNNLLIFQQLWHNNNKNGYFC